jgi:hypothetical protein
MRRILVENARRKARLRHGGRRRIDLKEDQLQTGSPPEDLLAIHEALDQLALVDQQAAELVKLRYFVGMTAEQAADVLGKVVPRRETIIVGDFEHNTVRARDPLPRGKVAVKLEYTSRGLKPGGTLNTGATVKLFVNGKLAGEGAVGTAMMRHGIEPFEVGRDSISPVSPDYKSKGVFAFTGRIEKITFDVAAKK